METTAEKQLRRRPYWQYLMNTTYPLVPATAVIEGSMEGVWERLIANQLYRDVYNDANPQAFELLAMTGDLKYTKETFYKAAVIILESLP